MVQWKLCEGVSSNKLSPHSLLETDNLGAMWIPLGQGYPVLEGRIQFTDFPVQTHVLNMPIS